MMMMEGNNRVGLVLICLCVIYVAMEFATVRGNIGDFDEAWQQRSREAKAAAREAYTSNPHNVTWEFNKHVHMYVYFKVKMD